MPYTAASNPLLVEQQPSGKEYSNDPVFYGPDGKILSEEESAFLWGATQPSNDYYDEEEEYVHTSSSLCAHLCGASFGSYASIFTIFFLDFFSFRANSNDDALVEPEPEMDLEIQLAFKEFVTYQNKK